MNKSDKWNPEKLNQIDLGKQDEVVSISGLDTDYTEAFNLNWKNKPDISVINADILSAKPYLDTQISKIKEYRDNLNVTGSAKFKPKKGKSGITPMLIRKQAEWRYASLSEPFLSTSDLINVEPVTAEDKPSAKQNEILLNNQWNTKINKVKFIDDYVRTLVDEGTAILKVGWISEKKEMVVERTVEVPVGPSPDMGMIDPLNAENPVQGLTGTITKVIKEKKEVFVKNHPVVEVCVTENVIIDPTCQGDISRAKFIVHMYESSLSDLKKCGLYKNLDMIPSSALDNNVYQDQHYTNSSKDSGSFTFNDKPRKKLVVYDYWGYYDYDGSGIAKPILVSKVGDVIIRMEESPMPFDELPFTVVQYLPVRNSIYGEPDGALLTDNQKIMGAVMRGMIDILANNAYGQTATVKDAIDPINLKKMERGEHYQVNPHADPRAVIYTHTFAEIPSSAQYMLNLQQLEAESLTGVKAFSNGLTGTSLGNTATGIRSAIDAAGKRELGILRRISKGIIDVCRMMIALNAEFLDDEEVVRVTNSEFVPIKRDDLKGNFDLRLTISTAEADNDKAKELAFMLQTMGNNQDPAITRLIQSEIAELRKMPKLAKMIREYQPQPDPVMQQKMQIELQKMQLEIEKLKAEAAKDMAQAELERAKISTEKAKARHIHSDADIKDLTFVEQEKGVNHARDLQKMDMSNAMKNTQSIPSTSSIPTSEVSPATEYLKDIDPEMGDPVDIGLQNL